METRRPGERIARVAQWLCDAHEQRQRFYPLPKHLAPRNAEEAYAIQDAFVALRARKLGAIGGYQLARHPLELIADNAWNQGAVLGFPVTDWQRIDLAAVHGKATINGRPVGEGRGADALGHPLDALAWIADHLAKNGRALLRGDVVITGSLVTTKAVGAGDFVEFAVEGLGKVELRVD